MEVERVLGKPGRHAHYVPKRDATIHSVLWKEVGQSLINTAEQPIAEGDAYQRRDDALGD